jgi:tetratricopeptide (TPR) repeat protein
MKTFARLVLLFAAGLSISTTFAQSHHEAGTAEIQDLGHLDFESSGLPAAQPHLIRGLLLLHSFEYASAAQAFRNAQTADPDFAMAYWGEAMTFNHTIWGEQDRAAARAVLSRLGATNDAQLAKARTPREKAYLAAVQTLYGEGTKKERDAAYGAAMERLAAVYPNDLDARAFYALSLLGLSGSDRDSTNYMRAAAVAEEIYEASPRHPGALHYLIHAYDDPLHAPLGLRAARRYGKLAPAASHALHMPSHIFFALGMWDESIEANVASLDAARRGGTLGTHPLHWLVYAYLQQGRRDDAAALVRMLAGDLAKKPAATGARYAMAQVCGTWLAETGSGSGVPCETPVDRTGIKAIDSFAGDFLARGLVAVRAKDLTAARSTLTSLTRMIDEGKAAVGAGDAPSRLDQVSAADLALANVMAEQLRAAILFAEGKQDAALLAARDAAAAERGMVFEYGPPRSPKPPAELYADLLVAAGRFAEARAAYEETLQRTPARAHTLAALADVAKRLGDTARATELNAQWKKQWRAADSPK